PAEPRFRIFQRVPQQDASDTLLHQMEQRRAAREPVVTRGQGLQSYTLHALVEQAAYPVLVLDPAGRIQMASSPAREAFHLSESMLGRNIADLDEAFRPAALRLAIEDARGSGRLTLVDEVRVTRPDGSALFLRVSVRPVLDPRGALLHIVLWGQDLSEVRGLADELTRARQELETVSEELQSTNEELETTNEELQSTNEELETTNEELQSTNEELETTIEELQSTNEELETANDELRSRQEALNTLTRYQDMVLSGLHMGLIVLDRHFIVSSWNKTCEETWGLREEEVVGRDLFSLDIGLNLQPVREAIVRVLSEGAPQGPFPTAAINRRGKPIQCRLRINPLLAAGTDGAALPSGSMLIVDGIADG
ncbi:MAG: methyltransferase, partial [Armatimonadetes bacterium]|nr:methyltransferase [Armatimonadota bacterium]